MSDPEEPGPHGEFTVIVAQRAVGANEHVLEYVFGIVTAGQHLSGVSRQALVVAVVDDLECPIVSGPEQRHQLFIGPEPEQAGTDRDAWRRQCPRRVNC